MDDIESSITELNRLIVSKAPRCRPSVFPSNMGIQNIFDICGSDENSPHRAKIQRWLDSEQCTEDQIVFLTEFDYKQRAIRLTPRKSVSDTDKMISSLDQMMELLVSGTDKNLNGIVNSCFMERNNFDEKSDESKHILYEVCNLCYSLKVLISNIPGIKFTLGGHTLPLDPAGDVGAILRSLKAPAAQGDDEPEEDDVEEVDHNRSTKKRRKKRGGK